MSDGHNLFGPPGLHESVRVIPNEILTGICLWRVDLDHYAKRVSLSGLSPKAYEHAEGMAFEEDRRRFLASRHSLMTIVMEFLGDPPQFVRGRGGKPYVRNRQIEFSLSRSGALGLVGVSRTGPIGVDIERSRIVPEAGPLVRDHFTSIERSEWTSIDSMSRDRAFLLGWTRKEAVVKALGVGVTHPLGSIHVGITTSPRTATVQGREHAVEVTVHSLSADPEWIGAAAIAHPPNPE